MSSNTPINTSAFGAVFLYLSRGIFRMYAAGKRLGLSPKERCSSKITGVVIGTGFGAG